MNVWLRGPLSPASLFSLPLLAEVVVKLNSFFAADLCTEGGSTWISPSFLSRQNGEVSASTLVVILGRYLSDLAEELRCLTLDIDVAMSRFEGSFFADVDFCRDTCCLISFTGDSSFAGVMPGV